MTIEDEETRQKLSNILSDNMRLMEEFGQSKYEAGEQKGEKRGIVKTRHEIAENLLKEGLPLELISQVTGVSVGRLELLNYCEKQD